MTPAEKDEADSVQFGTRKDMFKASVPMTNDRQLPRTRRLHRRTQWTIATAGSELDQRTATGMALPFASAAVAVTGIVLPAMTSAAAWLAVTVATGMPVVRNGRRSKRFVP